jgi:solute carrier family 6 GABA transporter-like protein 1
VVYNIRYFAAQVASVTVGQSVMPAAGAGVGFGLFITGLVVSLVLAGTADSPGAPKFWQKNMLLGKVYYLALYSGNQLRRDLNLIIGLGKNCKLSFFWSPLLRYITGPVLAIVFSFADPGFQTVKNDPMYIPGFIVAQLHRARVRCAQVVRCVHPERQEER